MSAFSIAFALTAVVGALLAWILHRRRVVVAADEIAATLPWFGIVGVAVAVGRTAPSSSLSAGFLKSPTVYLAVGSLVTGLWLVLDTAGVDDTSRWTVHSGVLVAIGAASGTLLAAEAIQMHVLAWNVVAVVLAVAVTGLVLQTVPDTRWSTHGWLGTGVLFAHVLDATTTGVGLERLGATERNPVSATIIQLGDGIGPSGVVLFLLVKVMVASFVLTVLDTDPDRAGRDTVTFLVVAAAAGLVPAVHNLTLFALTVR
ncbi:DUF63 family protein [Halobacterium rubrum]|uniref:DUF63 family protein n=1 Tax=Halobacterium TaxID=2239 RepID=UPI001F44C91A|nr:MULTISPECIES: DUF63 family protein [Halobacterium]MDH5020333.1 DUF63 family protein [Halobacterium rubrum]